MTIRLADIGVRLYTGGLGGGAAALLNEVAGLLERLARTGKPGLIDLRNMPLDEFDRERLHAALGEGEIEATLRTDGISRFRETGTPGVWWIEHRDVRDGLIAELLEIAPIPDILSSPAEELERGALALRARLDARIVSPKEAP